MESTQCANDMQNGLIEMVKSIFGGVIDIVAKQPTIDAVPVVHGYNTKDDSPSLFGCSVCGWFCWDTYCGDTDTYNYCPNCGAKMDGADGERKDGEG